MTTYPDTALEWAESLPPACPPSEARKPQNETFYRLVSTNPPTEKDFYSQYFLFPHRNFSHKECIAKAISLFDNPEACSAIRKYPTLKDKKMVKLSLPPESGVILAGSQNHLSWWRVKNFNPIPHCTSV